MRPARTARGTPMATQTTPARQRPSPSPRSVRESPVSRRAANTGTTARSSAAAAKCSGGASGAAVRANQPRGRERSEEHTSELQSRLHLVCRLLLEKKKKKMRLWNMTTEDTDDVE